MSALIERLNALLDGLLELLLAPLRSVSPVWSILLISAPTAVVLLLIFRLSSDQVAIRELRSRIQGHLLKFRLFRDEPRVLLAAQGQILLSTGRYVGLSLKPLIAMSPLVLVLLLHLDVWYGREPLRPGGSTVLTVRLGEGDLDTLSRVSVEGTEGLEVETSALRVPSQSEVSWRLRARSEGRHRVRVSVDGEVHSKEVMVAADSRLDPTVPRVVSPSVWGALLNPGEDVLEESELVRAISVDYPERSVEVCGRGSHWTVPFCAFTLLLGWVFKGPLRVQV